MGDHPAPAVVYTIITGLDWSSLRLLASGIISLLWGIALLIFSKGVVPVSWTISQYGRGHPDIINTITTLIATASTTHLKYTFQGILDHYSYYVLVDGFTLKQLNWMQGMKEWSFFKVFKFERYSGWKWSAWLVFYLAMALHSASVVSILQPNTFIKTLPYNNHIPCATDPSSLSLDALNNFPRDIQSQIDQSSYEVGLQLGNYVAQVSGNTTTAVASRVYVKDNYAYGAMGFNSQSLQETPGVLFNAFCAGEPNTPNDSVLWASVFPGRSPPMFTKLSNGSQSFSDQPIPLQMRSIVSDPVFNFNGSEVGMYALVYPSGSGGLVLANASGPILHCVWQATPKTVHVQIVNYQAETLGSQDSNKVPQLTGRAVLLTLKGMAQSVRGGGNLNVNDIPQWQTWWGITIAPTSTVLQTLLADGGKAALTMFNEYFSFNQGLAGFSVCDNNNRNVNAHWTFGNQHNLGWIAIVLTVGVGLLNIVAMIWFIRRRRVQGIEPLQVAHVFMLPSNVVENDGVFRVKDPDSEGEDIQEMEKAASKYGDHRRRNGDHKRRNGDYFVNRSYDITRELLLAAQE